jgi:8-oxo-dGTP pyrophosphatase MutT (NUDIX family)
MLRFKVLVDGVFSREQLRAIYIDKENIFPEKAVRLIEKVWSQQGSSGTRLFDGKLFDLISYRVEDNILSLVLQKTSYKHFVGTRDIKFSNNFPRLRVNPLSVGAVVVTSDNQFLIGERRTDLYFNAGNYDIIAGIMDREKDFFNRAPDPFEAILRELWEEKGVSKDGLREILSLGLIYNIDYNQTYMPFCIRLRLSSADLEKSQPNEFEFEKFIYVKADGTIISDFLSKNWRVLSQTCLGNILMFGKSMFGRPWLITASKRLGIDCASIGIK